MTSTYMHMQGPQYSYKIKYEDVNCMFLLPKLDGGRMAFVIALDKAIRQGNQKYDLELQSHHLRPLDSPTTSTDIKTSSLRRIRWSTRSG